MSKQFVDLMNEAAGELLFVEIEQPDGSTTLHTTRPLTEDEIKVLRDSFIQAGIDPKDIVLNSGGDS